MLARRRSFHGSATDTTHGYWPRRHAARETPCGEQRRDNAFAVRGRRVAHALLDYGPRACVRSLGQSRSVSFTRNNSDPEAVAKTPLLAQRMGDDALKHRQPRLEEIRAETHSVEPPLRVLN
jgi:hypothetical protein